MADTGLELLTEQECLRLLRGTEVGRIGITMNALPAIFPVNYCMVDGAIVFRTGPGTKMTAAVTGAVVAFEVDDYGIDDHSGWSVLVVGRAEVVDDPAIAAAADRARLHPFVDGDRSVIARIEPTLVSGRRIVHPIAAVAPDAG